MTLKDSMLKPYSQNGLTPERRIFNYRLSRARRVVENAFGILANRFLVFMTPINLAPEKVEITTLACCILHNFLRSKVVGWHSRFTCHLEVWTQRMSILTLLNVENGTTDHNLQDYNHSHSRGAIDPQVQPNIFETSYANTLCPRMEAYDVIKN